jgi:signal transduction histidine kinase
MTDGAGIGDTRRDTMCDVLRRMRGTLPLALVGLALLGSVAIPARQTWRISFLLHETTEVLAPARLLVERLQAGLAEELVALQGYALSGDGALLGQYEDAAAKNEQRFITLDGLASRLSSTSATHARVLRDRTDEWHRINGALIARRSSRAEFASALRAEQVRYNFSMTSIADLSSNLAAEAAARDDRVRTLEHFSIVANGALVLAALIAMSGVGILTLRERRLTATLRRRVMEESALRLLAEDLASANTVEELTQRIAQSALKAVSGSGAFVELIDHRPDEQPRAVVRAVSGNGAPPLGESCPLSGSYAALVTMRGRPILLEDLSHPERRGTICVMPGAAGSAVAVPLGSSATPFGALFVISDLPGHFRHDDVTRAGLVGHLAALAHEKIQLLDEALERRRVLERVIQSRSRLMRGFSHDVKNPIGAADGFAELLSLGVYGTLTAEQQSSIDRMRRSIRSALALIDDLHELAHAETGNLALRIEPVDLAALMRTIGEEYHATAHAHGLSVSVETEEPTLVMDTDGARVRQIIANLVSNAIKYSTHGSITMRAHRQAPASGEESGWVLLEVVDTGIGIPTDKQEYIFEEFSRLDAGHSRGAGLGLAISKLLSGRLGGHVSVTSAPGRGSTFTLWLPLRPSGLPS